MMTISQEVFYQQCVEFVRRCQEYSDSWSLSKPKPGGQLQRISIEDLRLSDKNSTTHDEIVLVKSEQRKIPNGFRVGTYEYTVVYSESYEVPVMYFCVSDQNGCPIPVEEVLNSETTDLSKVVSQVEHPLLFRPFYMIHPCRTKSFMQPLNDLNQNGYLISWLSIVGTLLGLKLSHKFGRIS